MKNGWEPVTLIVFSAWIITTSKVTSLTCTYTLIHESGIFICYRLLWQHCVSGRWACSSLKYTNLHPGPCVAMTSAADGATWTHPSSLVPSYASGFLISLGPPALSSWLARTLLADCRSFTLCQGESTAARWSTGQSLCATPTQVRWVQAIHEGARRVVLSLLAASEEFVAVERDKLCRTLSLIWSCKIKQLDYFWSE